MTIAVTSLGTNKNAATGSVAITIGASGVPANALIVVVTDEAGSITAAGTVGDTAGNTYTKIASGANNGTNAAGWGAIFYAWNTAQLVNTNTITYTKNTTGGGAVISALYAIGIQTSADPLDAAVTASATGNSTTPSVTSGTPGASGELIVGAITYAAAAGATTITQDSTNGAYATPPDSVDNAGSGSGAGGGNLVNAGSAAKTYAPTLSAGRSFVDFIVGFKAAAPDVLFAQASL